MHTQPSKQTLTTAISGVELWEVFAIPVAPFELLVTPWRVLSTAGPVCPWRVLTVETGPCSLEIGPVCLWWVLTVETGPVFLEVGPVTWLWGATHRWAALPATRPGVTAVASVSLAVLVARYSEILSDLLSPVGLKSTASIVGLLWVTGKEDLTVFWEPSGFSQGWERAADFPVACSPLVLYRPPSLLARDDG